MGHKKPKEEEGGKEEERKQWFVSNTATFLLYN